MSACIVPVAAEDDGGGYRLLGLPKVSHTVTKRNKQLHKGESTPGNMGVFLNLLVNCRQAEESIKVFFKRKRNAIIGTSSSLESSV